MNKLASLLNIEPGEGRLASLLFLHSFLMGMANNFVQTAAFALFMAEFDAQTLAWVYIANALVIPLFTFLYLRLGNRLAFSRLLLINLGFLSLITLVFWLGLRLSGARLWVFTLPILFQVVVNFGNLEFWTLAGRLLNVRQGKRLFGLVGAGLWLAIVITGLLIPPLVAWLGTVDLLLLSVGSLAGALGLVVYITRAFADHLVTEIPSASASEKKPSALGLLKSRYVVLIFVLIVLWWLVYFFLDNVFYDIAAVQYPDADSLAGFLGIFLAALGVVTLLSNTFVSGPVVSHHGVRVGLLILPLVLVAGTGTMAVIVTISDAVSILFWLTVVTKLLDMAVGFSIDRSALNILYQPLPAGLRGRVQALAEGVFQPLANGLAGVALLGLSALFASGRIPLMVALFLVAAVWLLLAILIGREYPAMLMSALRKRRLDGVDISLVDRSSIAVLQRELQSPHPGVVIYALNTLEAMGHAALPGFLTRLLEHPAPEVRRDVLQRVERLRLVGALPAVGRRVAEEPDPSVRGVAVCALAALGQAETLPQVSSFLNDPVPQVRKGAMVGLLRSGGIEGVLSAGHTLLQMVDGSDPAERALAAQVLGEVGIGSFYQPLESLLQDEDLGVQRVALLAAGQLRNANLWPLILEKLGSPPVRRAAAAALVAGGAPVLSDLIAAFARKDDQVIQAQLVKICGRIGGEEAVAWLKGHLAHPNTCIRTQVLRALGRCGYQAEAEEGDLVQERVRAEAALSALTLAVLVDIGDGEAVDLLRGALSEVLGGSRERILFLLSFLYDRRTILQARDNLTLPSDEKRAYALEVIDVLVPATLQRTFLPLLTDLSPEQKLRQLQELFPQPEKDRQQRLHEIIAGSPGRCSVWTRACALYAVGRLTITDLEEPVAAALSSPEPLIREAALWALSRLDGTKYRVQIQALCHDPSPQVSCAARRIETANWEGVMLSTIEKVIALKKVSIFAETPDETLAAVAALLEEMPVNAGDTVVEKGDLGDCLYIVVDGEFRVYDGDQTLNRLREGDVFGEMAIFDAEPRSAWVTAVTDARLLRLDQEPVYELMEDRSEVARGVIRVLSRRLRAREEDFV